MRNFVLAAFLLTSVPAMAQNHWTAAPTPSTGAGDIILPTARTGDTLDADHSTPFSSVPSGSFAADGATSTNSVNGVTTPNLSK